MQKVRLMVFACWVLLIVLVLLVHRSVQAQTTTLPPCPDYVLCVAWTQAAFYDTTPPTAMPATALGDYTLYVNGKAVANPKAGLLYYQWTIPTGTTLLPTDNITMASAANGILSKQSAPIHLATSKGGKPLPPVAPVMTVAQ